MALFFHGLYHLKQVLRAHPPSFSGTYPSMSLGAEAYDELEMNVTAADLDPYTSGPWPDQKKKIVQGWGETRGSVFSWPVFSFLGWRLLLKGPLRLPNHRAPNKQFTISSVSIYITRWWFQTFVFLLSLFGVSWSNLTSIFFKWVETTN